MRNYILQQYTTITNSTIVRWHNGSVHTRSFFEWFVSVFLVWIIYTISMRMIPSWEATIKLISWIIWMIFYIRFIIWFLNKYLDAFVINPDGVILFEREWLLRYKLQQFDRDSIESISHSQNSLIDRLIGKWDIQIIIERGSVIIFEDIGSPHSVSQILQNYKKQYSWPIIHKQPMIVWESSEKFEILVETLWEVIKEYMGKHDRLPHKEKRDM
jgi:hypothetical protein